MKASFDKDNHNLLILEDTDKKGKAIKHYIAVPPGLNRIDLYNSPEPICGPSEKNTGYLYNFTGLAIITNSTHRMVYYKGELLIRHFIR